MYDEAKVKLLSDSFKELAKNHKLKYHISTQKDWICCSCDTSHFNGNIVSRSHGGNYWDATYFIINETEFYLIDTVYWGLNIGKLRKVDGRLIEVRNFKLETPLSSDSIVNFLNTFDTTHILILAKSYPASNGLLTANIG